MKHLFTNAELAHIWMHQRQDEGHNAGRSFYFNGDTIYSYGSHFPIARHVTGANGEPAILFTTRSYSVTTSGHISRVRRAIPPSARIFFVRNPGDSLRYEIDAAGAAIRSNLERAASANKRNAPKYYSAAIAARDAAIELAAFFALDTSSLPELPNAEDVTRVVKEWREAERIEAEARAKRQAREQKIARNKAIKAFLAGDHRVYVRNEDGSALLRVNGDMVVTSMGAQFPLDHARKGLQLVRRVMSRGYEWIRNGHTFRLGHYGIDRIEVNGTVHAGCHVVTFAEIERIAGQLEAKEVV